MSRTMLRWFGAIALLVAVAVITVLRLRPAPTDAPKSLMRQRASPAVPDKAPDLRTPAEELLAAQTPDAKRQALSRLRQELVAGSTNDRAAQIRRFLDTGADANTSLGFRVGANGALMEAPTLRIWMLEELAKLDPSPAAQYAREILDKSGSADEWAVALRNLARHESTPEARQLLKNKMTQLLTNDSWQKDPSVGYLEAFDVAVYLGGTDLMSTLSDLLRKKDNPAVAHAAYLTVDRLIIDQPAEILGQLVKHPEWMQGREQTRANYFARADLNDPAQRLILESYLLDPVLTEAELQTFAGLFPNANFMISQNLLTKSSTVDGSTLAHRDRAAAQAVGQWLGDVRFERLRPSLVTIQERLNAFNTQRDIGRR